MANLNASSEDQSQAETSRLLRKEAELRINDVASKIIDIINNNPEKEQTLKNTLRKQILDTILKNPLMVQSVLEEVDRRFNERLEKLPSSERLKAIKWYADLTESLWRDIAKTTLDINLDNAINKARTELDKKSESLRQTYKQIELQLKNEIIPKK